MNYQYVKDETDTIIDIKVNGKSVKKSSMRGFKKAQKVSFFNLNTQPVVAQNPYSGVTVNLNPLEATIYEFCQRWYRRYSSGMVTHVPVQTYDDMKYFLLELNPQAYMSLLD